MKPCGSLMLILGKTALGGATGLVVAKEAVARSMSHSIGRNTPVYKGADMSRQSPFACPGRGSLKYFGTDAAIRGKRSVSPFVAGSPPDALMHRTEWHPDNVPTYNDLGGSQYSVTAYENTRDLYYDIVNGDFMPRPYEHAIRSLKGSFGMLRSDFDDLECFPVWNSDAQRFLQHVYKIPKSQMKYYSPQALVKMRSDNNPGWAINSSLTMSAGWAVKARTAGNYRAVIFSLNHIRPHNEHPVQDKVFRAYLASGSCMVSQEIDHPFQGIKTDTLNSTGNFAVGTYYEGFEVSKTQIDGRGAVASTYQEMAATMEAIGVEWVYYHDKGMQWPAERHKLYTANFPYRGLTKKAIGEKGFIRQKGGNSKRVVEWHPHLKNHYESKTEEELFA